MIKKRSAGLLGAGLTALLLSATSVVAIETKIDLDANPALQALADEDPTKGQEVFNEIDRLMQLPVSRNLLQQPQGEKGQLLLENPALKEIYRRDPKATSKLLSTLLPLPN